jgi:multiple sugar transport system substrate-binding protein
VHVITRRAALAALGTGLGLGAAACGGFGFSSTRPVPDDVLLVTHWAASAERPAFEALAAGFTRETGVPVSLQRVPFSQALTTVDTGLRAGQPPDVFRVTYSDVGFYRAAGVLAELPELPAAFGPAFAGAVSDDAGVFGVPHHTDTSMLVVDVSATDAAGIGPLPVDPDDAWSWAEFADVARRVAAVRPDGYAVAVNWQAAGAYRWLNWVDQAGGRLLVPSLDAAVAPDDPGVRAALAFTRGLFRDGLTPPAGSTGGQDASELFTTGTAAMVFLANFLVPDLDAVAIPWTAVPLPRDARASADLGGNALVATTGPRQEQATAFLRYCAEPEQMAAFCAAASALPTRTDVPPIAYPVRPGEMERFVAQAATISPDLVEQVTVPAATAVNLELVDGLERAFLGALDGGGDPDEVVAADLLGAVDRAVRRLDREETR